MSVTPEKWTTVQEIGTVRGIVVGVYESSHSFKAMMREVDNGWHDICQVDKTDPGAKARAISLAETVFDALEVADMTWEDTPEARP